MVKNFNISKYKISKDNKPFIIAEIGVNHNGSLKLAKKLIDKAKEAGADCVKFQTFDPSILVSNNTKKAPYQIMNTKNSKESQFKMLNKLKLNFLDHKILMKYCKTRKILFLSTPYNFSDVDMLKKLNVSAFKLASMHLTEPVFIEYVAKQNKPIILSSGMSNFKDVKMSVKILKKNLKNKFILMQCTTNYPSDINEANINVIKEFNKKFRCHTGFSDHTNNNIASVVAVSLGAVAIEKHFTLDKNMAGPDHKSSLNPEEFKTFVKNIKEVKIALGNKNKIITKGEKKNIKFMKRSIYIKRNIKKGTKIKLSDLEFKRPLDGISSNKASWVIGKKVLKDLKINTKLNRKHLDN